MQMNILKYENENDANYSNSELNSEFQFQLAIGNWLLESEYNKRRAAGAVCIGDVFIESQAGGASRENVTPVALCSRLPLLVLACRLLPACCLPSAAHEPATRWSF
jgi:hypothetical protein